MQQREFQLTISSSYAKTATTRPVTHSCFLASFLHFISFFSHGSPPVLGSFLPKPFFWFAGHFPVRFCLRFLYFLFILFFFVSSMSLLFEVHVFKEKSMIFFFLVLQKNRWTFCKFMNFFKKKMNFFANLLNFVKTQWTFSFSMHFFQTRYRWTLFKFGELFYRCERFLKIDELFSKSVNFFSKSMNFFQIWWTFFKIDELFCKFDELFYSNRWTTFIVRWTFFNFVNSFLIHELFKVGELFSHVHELHL